jgi:hypothetical protein
MQNIWCRQGKEEMARILLVLVISSFSCFLYAQHDHREHKQEPPAKQQPPKKDTVPSPTQIEQHGTHDHDDDHNISHAFSLNLP